MANCSVDIRSDNANHFFTGDLPTVFAVSYQHAQSKKAVNYCFIPKNLVGVGWLENDKISQSHCDVPFSCYSFIPSK
jgi:hypothetical protein